MALGMSALPRTKIHPQTASTLHAGSIPWSLLCPKLDVPGAIPAGTDPNQADDGMVQMHTTILEPPTPACRQQ